MRFCAYISMNSRNVIQPRFGNKQKTMSVAFFLVAASMVFYSGVLGNGFVNFDDNDYVTSNAIVQNGLSWEGIKWAFTSFHANNWHPLTWLSHMFDVHLFGLNPAGHHLMNLLFHICATLLLFGFLSSATGKIQCMSSPLPGSLNERTF